ncbi:SHS2 domain-containing protein [Saccharomonospora amisosensis]|uniref:SHS2 domain-containing protein n=1 Tax=Saccharomonospora amisosensis TaxID=1128677 RepID=A0A7X5UNJ9_9PSEU|nr:archease [Saccharomonospora amisosensis]NIJ11032.1 SHS2 domain-containing protein [Saccharomonospora amisosensis]
MTGEVRAGYREPVHSGDLRIEAWGPSRERCIAEAVSGMVESFAGGSLGDPDEIVDVEVDGTTDEELLAAVLDEVLHRMETTGRIPATTQVLPAPHGLRVRFGVVDIGGVIAAGPIPKAVCAHGLTVEPSAGGWACTAAFDV